MYLGTGQNKAIKGGREGRVVASKGVRGRKKIATGVGSKALKPSSLYLLLFINLGSISSDDGVESLGQSSDQETNPNTFKRPFNRKGRLIDNYENEHDPVPGPSGSPGPYSGSSPGPSPSPSSRSSSLDKIPVYTQVLRSNF